VIGAYQEPWYWHRYRTEFRKDLFQDLVQGRSAQQYAQDVIQANGGGGITVPLLDGSLLIKKDFFSVTYDSSGDDT